MARRKLPLFTERTLAETKADQIGETRAYADKLNRVSCKEGCTNCCHHAIHATLVEGILIYQALAHRGLWTPSLQKRLQEHDARTWGLSVIVWHLSNLPCPLLEKGRCMVYDARPFVCRVTYSESDPADCHPHRSNEPGMLPRKHALESFYKLQEKLLGRHSLPFILLPLSKAVIIGSKIAMGDVDIENALRLLAKESET